MEELLEGMILQILDFSSILPTDFYDNVSASLTTYLGGSVLSEVNNIMRDTIFVIGASLLTLFMLMEFVQVFERYNSDGGISSITIPANLLIKFGIYTFLYCNLGKILLGIQELALKINAGMGNAEITIDTSTLNTITSVFSNMGVIEKLASFILIIIVFCVTQIIFIVIQTTVFFRIFELFIVYMFAPIPLATLASNEFKHVAFNYLKNFLAISLQSAVILASFKLYNIIIVSCIPTEIPDSGSAWDIFIKILMPIAGYLFVLAVAVFSSGRISKSLVNAM